MTSNFAEAGAFIRTDESAPTVDFQLFAFPMMLKSSVAAAGNGLSFAGYPTKATSRGQVALRSRDPLSKPFITFNYLAHEEERRIMREGVRRILDLSEQPVYRDVITKPIAVPGSRSDADIDAFVSRHLGTGHHASSTCPIGEVVDADLRVKGIEGLRVIDASVMPDVSGANTNAAATMIGEKGADLVRGFASAPGSRRESMADVV
jgi:choline dehydrogenase